MHVCECNEGCDLGLYRELNVSAAMLTVLKMNMRLSLGQEWWEYKKIPQLSQTHSDALIVSLPAVKGWSWKISAGPAVEKHKDRGFVFLWISRLGFTVQ